MSNSDKYFDFPSNFKLINESGIVSMPWAQVFQRWQSILTSEQETGITANRPVTTLWVGRRYFDTTLGYPVYVKQVKPVIIWVNGAGTAV